MCPLSATTLAACPFSIAQTYTEDYLREAEAGGATAILVAGPLRRRVTVSFGSNVDETEPGRPHEQLSVRWSAHSPFIPDFAGCLRFRIAGQETRLVLEGKYVPPGGWLGIVFDAAIGRRIAQATADALLARIARDLQSREAAWRARTEPRSLEV
jgi:hypothetical protein